MVYLTRKAEFSASHYYHNPEFTPEENRRVFGKCNNPNGHGHNYTLEVTVKGAVDPRSGFVVDLKELKEIMHHEVLDAMDHRFLNKEVPEFASQIPTTENIAIAIWQRLVPKLQKANSTGSVYTRPQICLQISMEKHESSPHAALPIFRFPPLAQRHLLLRRKSRHLREVQ